MFLVHTFLMATSGAIRVSGHTAKYNIAVEQKEHDEFANIIGDTIRNDLNNSLKFNSYVYAPHMVSEMHYILNVDVQRIRPDYCQIQIKLSDPHQNKIVYEDQFNYKIPTPLTKERFRYVGHQIADRVLQDRHGLKSMFLSRIVAVKKDGPGFALVVCDYDGKNQQTLIKSPVRILGPKISPDGQYVLFRTLKPKQGQQLWVYHLKTGKHQNLSEMSVRKRRKNVFGVNISSASFGATPNQIIFSKSANASTTIYKVDLRDFEAVPLTQKIAFRISTCPFYIKQNTFVYSTDNNGLESICFSDNGHTTEVPLQRKFMGRVEFSQPIVAHKKLICSYRNRQQTGILVVDNFLDSNAIADSDIKQVFFQSRGAGLLEKPSPSGSYVLCRNMVGNHIRHYWICTHVINDGFVTEAATTLDTSIIEASAMPESEA